METTNNQSAAENLNERLQALNELIENGRKLSEVFNDQLNKLENIKGSESASDPFTKLGLMQRSYLKKRSEDLSPAPWDVFNTDKGTTVIKLKNNWFNEQVEQTEPEPGVKIYDYLNNINRCLTFGYGPRTFDLDLNEYLFNCYNTIVTEYTELEEIERSFYFLGFVPAKAKSALKLDYNALVKRPYSNQFPIEVNQIDWFNFNEQNYIFLIEYLTADSFFCPNDEYQNLLAIKTGLTRDYLFVILSDPDTFIKYVDYYIFDNPSMSEMSFEMQNEREYFLTPDFSEARTMQIPDDTNYNTTVLKALYNRRALSMLDFDYINLIINHVLHCFIELHLPAKDHKKYLEQTFQDIIPMIKSYNK